MTSPITDTPPYNSLNPEEVEVQLPNLHQLELASFAQKLADVPEHVAVQAMIEHAGMAKQRSRAVGYEIVCDIVYVREQELQFAGIIAHWIKLHQASQDYIRSELPEELWNKWASHFLKQAATAEGDDNSTANGSINTASVPPSSPGGTSGYSTGA